MERPPPPAAAESFDRSAQVYDGHVAANRAGARRLVASIPEGRYPRLLDVVQRLSQAPSARQACTDAGLADAELPSFDRALSTLVSTDMIRERQP